MGTELQGAVHKISLFILAMVRAMHAGMKKLSTILLLSTALSLAGCEGTKQLFDPETVFAAMEQPTVKGINDTQEDMAKEAMQAGDFGRAAQFYQQLIATEKGTPEQQMRYRLGMAEAARRLGDNAAALNMYQDLRGKYPANLDVTEGYGLTLMASGKISDAGQAFSEVVEKDPKRWRTLNALGILFVTKNMIPEATAYFTEANNQSPDNPAVLNNAGLSFAVDRNFPRAIEALQHASRVSKSPLQRKQVELNLALIYGVSGDFDMAREVAGKHLEGPALENNLGLYAHLAKNDALAKSYLNMALTQSTTYYERAWENLDAVSNAGASDSTDAKPKALAKPAARAALPKTDALLAPEPKAKPTAKPSKSKHKGKAAAAAEPEEVEPAIMIPPTVKADTAEPSSEPAAKEGASSVGAEAEKTTPPKSDASEAVKPEAKQEEKPAGFVFPPIFGN